MLIKKNEKELERIQKLLASGKTVSIYLIPNKYRSNGTYKTNLCIDGVHGGRVEVLRYDNADKELSSLSAFAKFIECLLGDKLLYHLVLVQGHVQDKYKYYMVCPGGKVRDFKPYIDIVPSEMNKGEQGYADMLYLLNNWYNAEIVNYFKDRYIHIRITNKWY